MKLKALLVDDEIHILNNLSKVLPWEAMGFELVGLAKNGVEALEAAIMHRPDLILSDIRMPIMDGMTLIEKVREHGLNSEIILLTGYQEFEYARTGIRFGVKDYICKPINYFELEDVVRDLAAQILDDRKKQTKAERLHEVAALINENLMLHALLGQEIDDEVLWWGEEEASYQRTVQGLLLLDLEGYSQHSITWSIQERKTWNLHIKHKLRELFGALIPEHTVVQVREGEWCLILHSQANSVMTKELLTNEFKSLLEAVREKELQQGMRICVKQSEIPAAELSSVYQRMQQLLILSPLNEWFLDADSMVPGQKEVREAEGYSDWRFTELIGNGLRNGNPEMLLQVAAELKNYIGRLRENANGQAVTLLHYLLIHLLREMRELQMLSEEQERLIWVKLQESLGLKELFALILSLLEKSREALATKKSSETLMMAAQNYIQQHLGKDFGIEDISDYLGISCSYFCLLFKNHFRETFVEYLTRQRIEMAKYLLNGSEKSITSIGAVVGYQERRYFTKVFQKYTGMTPSEYRSRESSVS